MISTIRVMVFTNIFWILLGLCTSMSQTIVTYAPGKNAKAVPADANLVLTFDQEMRAGKGKISILGGQNPITINVKSNGKNDEVTIEKEKVTIDPKENLSENKKLYVLIEEAVFETSTGKAFAGITDPAEWSFETAKKTVAAPTVSAFKPSDNAADAAPGSNLEITFGQPVKAGTGNVIIYQNGVVFESINTMDVSKVTITGNTVTINPTVDLLPGAAVYVHIDNNAFLDNVSGEAYPGSTDNTTWNFTVGIPDIIPPAIAAGGLTPADNATEVAPAQNLTITFSEPVFAGAGSLALYRASDNTLLQTLPAGSATITGSTVTLDPPADLPAGTAIYVQLATTAFRDGAGNYFAGIADQTSWNFTTKNVPDTTPPTVSTLTPADEATSIALTTDLSITFSEPIKKGTGSITIQQGSTVLQSIAVTDAAVSLSLDRKTVTINPGDFPSGASLYVQLSAGTFTDDAGNPFAGITNATTWNFTTIDNIPPTANLTPANGANNQEINVLLALSFSEPVVKGAGTITVSYGSTNQNIPLSSVTLSNGNRTATFDPVPAGDLPYNAAVSVTIPNTAFTDNAGNQYNGTTGSGGINPWSFTTGTAPDNTPPTAELDPKNGNTNVPITQLLTLSFSEAVEKGTGSITVSYGSTNQAIPLSSVTLTDGGKTARFDPSPIGDLPYNTAVSVTVPGTAFKDAAGNAFVGTSGSGGTNPWSFTTDKAPDTTPPTATLTPPNGSKKVAIDADLVLTFNEEVKKGAGSITINYSTGGNQVIDVNNAAVLLSTNRKVATINPNNFPQSAKIAVNIPQGTFKDLADNNYGGTTGSAGSNLWEFTTLDATAPSLTNRVPAPNDNNAALNANLQLTFSEPVVKGSGTITLSYSNGGSQSIEVSSINLPAASTTVTIDPNDFPGNTTIGVTIPASAFKDEEGNDFAGTTAATWSFTTLNPDNTAPTIAAGGFNPADNATGVVPGQNLTITFSEKIKKGASGTITLYVNGTAQPPIDITSGNVSIAADGLSATIDPPADFPYEAAVAVRIAGGAFTDLAGNAFAGIADNTTWNFSVAAAPDNTPPVANTFTPIDNATGVEINQKPTVTFSEPIKKGTGNVTLNVNGTNQVVPVSDASIVVSGNTLTINRSGDFPFEANIYILIDNTVVTDLAGNAFAGIADQTNWNFTTKNVPDTTVPAVSALTPADNAANVPPAANLVITFNEPVKKGDGFIVINQGATFQTIRAADVTVAGNTVTIDPPADLPAGANVYVTITAGAFKDLADNNYAGISDPTAWNFSVADQSNPVIASLLPEDEATNVATTANLLITFSEAIKKGTGSVTLNYSNGGSQTVPLSSISVSGAVAVIDPLQPIPSGAVVTVQMPAGIFTDLTGNPFAGITDNTTWNFTVADVVAPTVAKLTPADNATGVGLTENLVIEFSEPVKKGNGNITIHQGSTTLQTIAVTDAAVSLSPDRKTVTINPGDFPSGASLYVQLSAGTFTDDAGNPFAGITNATTWNFTVGDVVPPQATSFSPADNTTGAAANANLVIVFNEPVKKGNGSNTISINQGASIQSIAVSSAAVTISPDGTTVTINPSDFPSSAAVYVTIPGGSFTDLTGNAWAGITSPDGWNFTVADVNAPSVVNLTPADNTINVTQTANLVIEFSEPVQKGTGSITINQGSTVLQTIAVSSAAVTLSADQKTVTIDPANFPSGAGLHVKITAGAFKDLENNAYPGISDASTWNFTVVDVTAPTISSLSPADNATGVDAGSNLTITFSEPVKAGTGSITIHQGSTILQTIAVSSAAVTIAGNVVTIDPTDFPSGANLDVQITAGAFVDADNNPFAGIADATTWNFTVKDGVPPAMTALSPADNATNVAPNANLEITFSEPVKIGSGYIFINQGTTQAIRVDDATAVTVSGNKVIINPPKDFPSGTDVNVLIFAGAFTDLSGNAFAGIADSETWNFRVTDVNAPYVVAFLPGDNEENVAPNTNLVMTFSEPVKTGTGSNLTIVLTYGNTSQLINVPSSAVTVTSNVVSINPPADLPSGAQVSVQITSGAFVDLENNPFPGITDATTWNFTISDVSAPNITGLSPKDDAGNVELNANLVITFSEPVKKGTGKITINHGATYEELDVNDPAVKVANTTVTIDPPADFPSGASVNIQMPSGVFLDQTNNAFAGITNATTWNFTAKDIGVPIIVSLSPADNTPNAAVNTNLVITFSEAIKKGSGSITINVNGSPQTIDVNTVSISGSTATIDPADFPSGASVNVLIPAGAFTDLSGNPFAGITSPEAWNFSVGDVTVPLITSLSPDDNAANVESKANLEIRFSEPVKRGATGFVLIDMGQGRQQVIPFDSPNITVSNDLVVIDPPNDFPYATDLFVRIQAGTFTDLTGNAFGGISTNDRWNFRTMAAPDFTPPTFSSLSPGDNAINVPVDVNLVINFSEPVLKGEGKISVVYGATTLQIDVFDPQVTLTNQTVTIDLTNNFPYNTGVSIQVPAGTFTDLAGNPFGGILSTTAWNFSVVPPPDADPPLVSSLSPEDNATNVPPSANLAIIFNEKVKKGTGMVIVNDGVNKQEIPVNSDHITISDNIVTINPPLDFPSSAGISIQVNTGAFTDLSGNKYAGINDAITWNFIVAATTDNKPPVLTATAPADEAVNVPVRPDLTLTFNEPVKAGSGFIFINQGGIVKSIDVKNETKVIISGNTITIKPDQFPSGARISVLIPSSVFLDLADNSYQGINDLNGWNFTIADNVAPGHTVQYPADDATGIPMNVNLMMIFNEEVQIGQGNIVIKENGNPVAIAITDASQVSIKGNTMVVNPANNFPPNSSISVQLPRGIVKDLTGNPFGGILTEAEWNFETGNTVDNDPPATTKLFPENSKTNAPVEDNLVITFNDVIQKGSGTIIVSINDVNQAIPVQSDLITITGNTVSINLPEDLPYLASVYILIPPGAFLDLANNAFAGFNDSGSWNFITTPVPPLSIDETRTEFPPTIDVNASNVIASIKVTKYPANTKAELVYRGISETEWQRMTLTEKDLYIPATLERPLFDEIGLEYYFELTPMEDGVATAAPIRSKKGYTYLRYPEGMVIPDLRFGTTANDYQILSIPLNLNYPQVIAVFEDDLVPYKKNRWRLFHHDDTTAIEFKENNFFDMAAGTGYWLILRDRTVLTHDTLDTGEGTTLKVTQDQPYKWTLKQGWNQIGNPYNFDLSWKDIKEYNNNPSALGNLRIFDHGYQESDKLSKLQGGFVFWDSESKDPFEIKVPVAQNRNMNGGRRSQEYRTTAHETSFWEVHFNLSNTQLSYNLGGLGMNPYAAEGKDALDDVSTPRFIYYLDLRFSHPEHFAKWLAKDMVPVQDNYQWEFAVSSNQAAQLTDLSWENFFTEKIPSGKRLVLFDLQNNKVVDLQENSQYHFWLDGSSRFRVLYGSPEFVASNLKPERITFGPAAPNPVVTEMVIPFSLPGENETYQVEIAVFDLQGRKVASLAAGTFRAGVHTIPWNGTGTYGNRVTSGVYICRMTVNGKGGTQMSHYKIVVQ